MYGARDIVCLLIRCSHTRSCLDVFCTHSLIVILIKISVGMTNATRAPLHQHYITALVYQMGMCLCAPLLH